MAGRVVNVLGRWGTAAALVCTACARPATERVASKPPTRVEATAFHARNESIAEVVRVESAAEVAPSALAVARPRDEERAPAPAAVDVPRDQTRAVVLMYHSIDYGPTDRSVTPELLLEHIRWLRSHDVTIVPLSAIVRFVNGEGLLPARVASITIDDGELSAFTNAFPVLSKEHAPFSLGLPTTKIEHPATVQDLEWPAIREMMASGLCEVASHGHTHENLSALTLGRARDELERSGEILREHLGVRPDVIFYPFGGQNGNVRKLARDAGYRAGFGAVGSVTDGATDAMHVPRYQVTHGLRGDELALFFSRKFPRPE